MILNHARQTPGQWDGTSESRCPDCGAPLVAKRGEIIVWHWAHYPGTGERSSCPHEETTWHLTWKAAYQSLPGWEIEAPVQVGDKTFRADAMNRPTGRIREFVHSLSPHYAEKHLALKAAGLDVGWILDGHEFTSLRAKWCRGGGMKRLLKPRAYELHRSINVLVHYHGQLWHEWRSDVWFPRTGERAIEVLRRFNAAAIGSAVAGEVSL